MKKVVICVCLTAFLFGTMEVALKTAGGSLDSVQLTFLRFFIGGLILAPMGIAEGRKKGNRLRFGDYSWLFLVGVMGIPISMLCFQLGVVRCNAATAASLICLNPVFTMVIAHLFTSEKMNKAKGLAFVIALVAMFFMIRPWDVQEGNSVLGMGLMLIASVTFAAYTVMGKRSIARVGTFRQTSLSFILGSLVLLVVLLVTGRPVLSGVAANWMIVAYCAVFVTGLGYMFYFIAIKYSDATTGSIAFFIKPAIAPILAVLLLHESIYWNTIVGIVLLITASLITLRDTWSARTIDDTSQVYEHEIDEIFAQRQPKSMDSRRYFACVIPLMERGGKDMVILEVRNKGKLHREGEICYPGGELGAAESSWDCAARELEEELGLIRGDYEIINQMDTYHGLTGTKIYCFVARVNPHVLESKDPDVKELFTVPAEYFLKHDPEMHHLDVIQQETEEFPTEEIVGKEGYRWAKGRRDIPVYHLKDSNGKDRLIWGVSALVTLDFSEIIRAARARSDRRKKKKASR